MIKERVSTILRKSHRLFGYGLPLRHGNDYATHVPILVGIGSAFHIGRILEFGSGFYSTLTFLNRLAFPDLLQVDSIESDPEWLSRIFAAGQGDPRLRMQLVDEPIERVLHEVALDDYDLILVDSSTEAMRRAKLIHELGTKSFKALVAVHDFEVSLYRSAAKPFGHCVESAAYNPCTGILWQADTGRATVLRDIATTIRRYSKKLQPDDVQSWSAAFRRQLGFKSFLN